MWWFDLKIKTHYVYSVTAAESLSDGYENGLRYFGRLLARAEKMEAELLDLTQSHAHW
jgi:hypothetical protein